MKRLAALFLFLLLLASPANATISTVENQLTVGGTGTQSVFDFSFVGDQSTDFNLIYTNSSGQQTTIPPSQFLVALNNIEPGYLWGVGGTLTYPLSGPPIANGTTLTIQRLIPLQQLVSISGQGDFNPQSVEQALDIIEMQTQQVSARTGQLRGTWATSVMYNYGDMVVDGVAGADTGNIYLCVNANTSGVWTTDLANGDWSLALNVQAIVNSTPSIGNNQLFGNISGIPATPVGVGGSAFLDSVFGSTQGSLLYRGGSLWTTLPPGTSGYFLQTNGAAANPSWVAAGGGLGTITGVTPSGGIAGGGTSGNVPVYLATVANNSLLANTSGTTASPGGTTLSAYLDSVLGATQGAILYRAGTVWSALAPGTAGEFLQTSGAAANPEWASAQITSAQLDSVFGSTQGNILYRGASAWTVLAPGTAGQVLQSGGTAANPSWAAGSNSGLILLDTVNASNQASVVFGSSYITSTYNKYVIEYDSVYTSDGGGLVLQFSANNGSTWIAANYYQPVNWGTNLVNTSSTAFALSSVTATQSYNVMQGTVKFSSPSSSAQRQVFEWTFSGNTVGGGATGGYNTGTGASFNAIKIFDLSGGNITGNFHLYGIAGT